MAEASGHEVKIIGLNLEVDDQAKWHSTHAETDLTAPNAEKSETLTLVPKNAKHVLDVGTGTGQWAIDYAKAHPNAQVLDTDLSAIQPKENVPPNCNFKVHNTETEWEFEHKFDSILGRMLLMGIHDWPAFFVKPWDNLKPGGWLEVVNPEFPVGCDNESAGPDTPIMRWSRGIREATSIDGIDTLIVRKMRSTIEEQGFLNIREERFKWATGPWPKGEKEKEIGHWMLPNLTVFMAPSAMGLITKKLNWPKEDVKDLVKEALDDLEDTNRHY
ncbi:S-adenosyl-L-methionine-dependent methyltransferase [Tothia fuscella]|uniref:S-adenosyl-L-methionine-dependent methyltransferase n=1 Tax=Tothia fuscella TaxID=1048955 RepID=A0A9P4TT56_9PEZI|nr:S-adenosyl-L-methionine-dependent methyltransferase [Tothia fuscella]